MVGSMLDALASYNCIDYFYIFHLEIVYNLTSIHFVGFVSLGLRSREFVLLPEDNHLLFKHNLVLHQAIPLRPRWYASFANKVSTGIIMQMPKTKLD